MRRELSPKRVYPVTRVSLMAAGIPGRYWDASLSKINDCDYRTKLIQYMVKIHEHVRNRHGLFIYGDFESGKTSAGVAILKEVIRRCGTPFYLKVRHILRAMYDNEETEDGMDLVRNRIRIADMLLLEDLGTEGFDSKKPGGAELEGVFRDRYDDGLPIMVTSNYAPTKLKTKYPRAIVNIIRRSCSVIQIETDQWETKDKKGTQ